MTDRNAFYEALKQGVVNITFTKKDGTVRTIRGTLQESFLPPKNPDAKKVERNEDMISVWSVDDKGWRGFNINQLQDWSV
jgi:hypothetical protein